MEDGRGVTGEYDSPKIQKTHTKTQNYQPRDDEREITENSPRDERCRLLLQMKMRPSGPGGRYKYKAAMCHVYLG